MKANTALKKGKRKPRSQRGLDVQRGVDSGQLVRLRQVGMIVPDRMIVHLSYLDATYGRTNNGSGSASWRLRMNSVYDPDPALGSGGITGFSELAALYAIYRVRSALVQWEAMNLESNPVMIFIWPSNSDLGINATSAPQYSEGPFSKKALLSSKGGMDKARISWNHSVAEIVGSPDVLYDRDLAAGTGGNPSTQIYLNFGIAGLAGPLTTNGIASALKIIYEVEFYQRKPLAS